MLATANAAKFAQNCPKLPIFAEIFPKTISLRNFEMPPNIEILTLVKISMNRGGTRTCFHHSDFQSKNFSYAIFIIKNQPLYVNFSIPPCGNR
jgi:hypothetical protein